MTPLRPTTAIHKCRESASERTSQSDCSPAACCISITAATAITIDTSTTTNYFFCQNFTVTSDGYFCYYHFCHSETTTCCNTTSTTTTPTRTATMTTAMTTSTTTTSTTAPSRFSATCTKGSPPGCRKTPPRCRRHYTRLLSPTELLIRNRTSNTAEGRLAASSLA